MIQLVKCFHKKNTLLLFFILINFQLIVLAESSEGLLLKQQIQDLKNDIEEQKNIFLNSQEKINKLIDSQEKIINQLNEQAKLIQNVSPTQSSQTIQDSFVLDKLGKPVAIIDESNKLYGYYDGNYLGKINSEKQVIRSFDDSIVAVVENNFLIGEDGYALGSIEKSENLRWEREKLFSQIQKTPISHYFIMTHTPEAFNLSSFRFSDWSEKNLSDILYFSEKKIQKLK